MGRNANLSHLPTVRSQREVSALWRLSPSLKREFMRSQLSRARRLTSYRSLAGKYQSPEGYQDWNSAMANYACHADPDNLDHFVSLKDQVALTASLNISFAFEIDPPALYLTTEMVNALTRTSVPAMEQPPNEVWPAFMVMLPKGMVVGDEGESISSILVSSMSFYLDRRNKLSVDEKKFEHEGLLVNAIADDGCVFHAHERWNMGSSDEWEGVSGGGVVNEERVKAVGSDLTRLAKNIVLLKNHQPELLTTAPAESVRHAGRGFGQQRGRQALPITWLGKNFVADRQGTQQADPSVAALKPHWRRGHWHTVCHGPKGSQRRQQWYQPTYVVGQGEQG